MMESWIPIVMNEDNFLDFAAIPDNQDKGAAANEASNEAAVQKGAPETREERMKRALAQYPLLYEIPFCYLIPHQSMLKEEEIRFFYLDFNWIRALLDGMFSLGRNASVDRCHDEQLIRSIYSEAIRGSANVRRKLQGNPIGTFAVEESDICTGFIMRSNLVRGFRGLEFNAYHEADINKEHPLPALRIETLAEDVLIGLYYGKIACLEIGEPPEGLYHGLLCQEGKVGVKIRSSTDGSQLAGAEVWMDVPPNHVLDIEGLAQQIGEKVEGPEMNGAQMALQLLRTARKLEINAAEGAK